MLPESLNKLLNKYVAIPIIRYHELGHAKAISRVIKKNPDLNQVKPIILIGDYKNCSSPISIDKGKRIIYFEQPKGSTKGITVHPDFAKMSYEDLIICLKAGYYREAKIYFSICILFLLSALACNSLLPVLLSIVPIVFFTCCALNSKDWKCIKDTKLFLEAEDWAALYSSYENLVK